MTTSEMSESFQDSATMATAVATTVVRLDAMDVAVEVTTDCMPPMSLVMRDWTSPVRVRVKKAMDCRCRCAKTRVRSVCMTCWPTLVLIQVCTTPSAEVSAATATMPAVSQTSRVTLRCGRAWSSTARSRNGEARPTTAETAMIAITDQQWPAVGTEQAEDAAQRDLAGLLAARRRWACGRVRGHRWMGRCVVASSCRILSVECAEVTSQ